MICYSVVVTLAIFDILPLHLLPMAFVRECAPSNDIKNKYSITTFIAFLVYSLTFILWYVVLIFKMRSIPKEFSMKSELIMITLILFLKIVFSLLSFRFFFHEDLTEEKIILDDYGLQIFARDRELYF